MSSTPRSPRVPLPLPVTLDDGALQLRCEGGNVSRTGLLVHPPREASLGRFVRARLSFPGQAGWIEVPAFQVREARDPARVAWGLRFIGGGVGELERIAAYVESLLKPGRSVPTR